MKFKFDEFSNGPGILQPQQVGELPEEQAQEKSELVEQNTGLDMVIKRNDKNRGSGLKL
ncbi:hypothetical protein F401_gp39 [Aeromonas phage phiAS7]|uniref:Uncharacterized protein n=1 Tax=Aeromonas phage phiAS7 TaxID=1141132 RepID=H6UK46_9CAUD|nr:hypothetical protein F401_gp39 [Aeromonas phage phiAS7]AEZ65062.1 hypothetical protein phiAS7_00039 [Aeromonas phage phiAS7]